MWTPPINISAGPHEWAVGYYVLGDPQAVTSLNVTDGSIAWGISPFAPMDWPTAGPLVALGSETIAEFNNTVPEPAAVSLLSLGVLTLACRRRH
jgi:hypothetical protein